MNTNSYFTVEILSSGNINLIMSSSSGTPITVYYWKNKEPNATRSNYDGSITTTTTAQNISNLVAGDKIKFYRAETTALSGSESDSWFNKLTGTSKFKVSGNIASLVGFSETLPEHCFRRLFYYSSAIIDAGELDLPWNTLSTECYTGMFYACSSLTVVPSLPATNLADYCYQYMFRQCTSLTKAQRILPATTLVTGCYYWMFGGCTVLETAPELPALLLVSKCYYNLFGGCRALNYIKAMFTSTPGSDYTNSWVYNVAENGTFIKNSTATWTTSGQSGIPSGWTVKNMNPTTQTINYSKVTTAFSKGNHSLSAIYGRGNVLLWGTPVNNYATQYFTAEIITGGTLWYMCLSSSYKWTLEYSKNNGTWYNLTADTGYGIGYSNNISVNAGDKIRFRKTGSSSSTVQYSFFWSNTCTYELYGNIMSLAYGDNFIGQTTIPGNYYFNRFCSTLNSGETNTWLKSIENLVLPATTLTSHCYDAMFAECTQITKAPVLPATTLVSHCYDAMFGGCITLRYIKAMFTTTPGSAYTDYWVVNIPSGGTFVKNSNATWNVTGNNGVPSGWTIEYA